MKYNLNQVHLHWLQIGLLSPFIFPSTGKWCHVRFLTDPSQLLINSPANQEYLLNITVITLDYFFWWKSLYFPKHLQTLELAFEEFSVLCRRRLSWDAEHWEGFEEWDSCCRCHSQMDFPFVLSWMSCCGAQPPWSCNSFKLEIKVLLCSPWCLHVIPTTESTALGGIDVFVSSSTISELILSHVPFLGLCCIFVGLSCCNSHGVWLQGWNFFGTVVERQRRLCFVISWSSPWRNSAPSCLIFFFFSHGDLSLDLMIWNFLGSSEEQLWIFSSF